MTEEQKQKHREAQKRYRDSHREQLRVSKKAWRDSHKEQRKAYAKEYAKTHHNEMRAKARKRIGYADNAAESIAICAEAKEKRRKEYAVYERYEQETAEDIATRYYRTYGN